MRHRALAFGLLLAVGCSAHDGAQRCLRTSDCLLGEACRGGYCDPPDAARPMDASTDATPLVDGADDTDGAATDGASPGLHFAPPLGYLVGQRPIRVVAADLDGDGRLDLATADYAQNTVSVLRGDGRGGFAAAVQLDAGYLPWNLAVGDLDGDGRPDLAVPDSGGDAIRLLYNQSGPDGIVFGAPVDLPSPGLPATVALGDLDGDGRLDVVCTHSGSRVVRGFLNGGGRAFAQASEQPTLGENPNALALGDLDGDGHLDALVGDSESYQLELYRGSGDGGLEAGRAVGEARGASDLALADLDGDGHLDVATADWDDGRGSTVQLGLGDGRFGPADYYDFGPRPASGVAVGDLDGDGRADVVVTMMSLHAVYVLAARAGGGFDERGPFPAGPQPTTVVLGDLDGDGRLDVATAGNESGNTVAVLLNRSR